MTHLAGLPNNPMVCTYFHFSNGAREQWRAGWWEMIKFFVPRPIRFQGCVDGWVVVHMVSSVSSNVVSFHSEKSLSIHSNSRLSLLSRTPCQSIQTTISLLSYLPASIPSNNLSPLSKTPCTDPFKQPLSALKNYLHWSLQTTSLRSQKIFFFSIPSNILSPHSKTPCTDPFKQPLSVLKNYLHRSL